MARESIPARLDKHSVFQNTLKTLNFGPKPYLGSQISLRPCKIP